MTDTGSTPWRIWTDDRGLAWADPGPGWTALRSALEDCAETLSPAGQPPGLSTYWVDRLLHGLQQQQRGVVAHGNLWVLTINDRLVEVRMDVDPSSSEPLEVVGVDEMLVGLQALRDEVVTRLAAGHRLDDRYWSQKNPA